MTGIPFVIGSADNCRVVVSVLAVGLATIPTALALGLAWAVFRGGSLVTRVDKEDSPDSSIRASRD